MNDMSACLFTHNSCCLFQFASTMEQAQSKFVNLPLATDVDSARRQLHQHQEIKNGEALQKKCISVNQFQPETKDSVQLNTINRSLYVSKINTRTIVSFYCSKNNILYGTSVKMVFIRVNDGCYGFCVADILEASKTCLDLGHALLDRIKEMGVHADYTNRHATTSACYGKSTMFLNGSVIGRALEIVRFHFYTKNTTLVRYRKF